MDTHHETRVGGHGYFFLDWQWSTRCCIYMHGSWWLWAMQGSAARLRWRPTAISILMSTWFHQLFPSFEGEKILFLSPIALYCAILWFDLHCCQEKRLIVPCHHITEPVKTNVLMDWFVSVSLCHHSGDWEDLTCTYESILVFNRECPLATDLNLLSNFLTVMSI